MLDHLMRLSISFCNRVQLSIELIVQYKRISSAYNGRYSSVSNLLHDLNWQPLQVRHKISRLQMFYKAVHNSTALSILQHFLSTSCLTRNYHQYHYIIPMHMNQNSFYPRTIKEWNQLPTNIIEVNILRSFSLLLIDHLI